VNLEDWFSAMGGIPGILTDLCASVVGGYAAFHSTFMTISQLYRIKSDKKIYEKTDEDDDAKPIL